MEPIKGIRVTLEEISHLPSDLHRVAAWAAIKRGDWTLVDEDQNADAKVAKATM